MNALKISANSKTKLFSFRELFEFKDLLFIIFRRDLLAPYKQSILGPAWFFLVPIFSSLIFTIVFGKLAKLSTDGNPQFLFYLSGMICWSFFSESFTNTANTFVLNQGLFGKVYFPRLIPPIAKLLVNGVRFIIQLVILTAVWAGYALFADVTLVYNPWALPAIMLAFILLSINAIGCGLILAALTAKYRDFKYILSFLVQVWMYVTPVIYPLSLMPPKYWKIAGVNPLTPVFELFRWAVFSKATLSTEQFVVSLSLTLVIFITGAMMFKKVEKTFMDTV